MRTSSPGVQKDWQHLSGLSMQRHRFSLQPFSCCSPGPNVGIAEKHDSARSHRPGHFNNTFAPSDKQHDLCFNTQRCGWFFLPSAFWPSLVLPWLEADRSSCDARRGATSCEIRFGFCLGYCWPASQAVIVAFALCYRAGDARKIRGHTHEFEGSALQIQKHIEQFCCVCQIIRASPSLQPVQRFL